ncbi:MAG: UpxY family transcription antiterminator [Chitinophagaceae bacterium]|jgi:transcription antitermination factor NusG
MNNKRIWRVLYVKPRTEKKVNEILLDEKIETWCPMHKVAKQWSDRIKVVEEPIFKSYIFVNIFLEQADKVKHTQGVLNYVYYLGKPAVVREQEIEEIKKYLKLDKAVATLQDSKTFNINDKVRISNGVFMNKGGKVTKTGKKKVYVQIESLGTVMSIEFSTADVEVV